MELRVGQRREDLLVGRRHDAIRGHVPLLPHPDNANERNAQNLQRKHAKADNEEGLRNEELILVGGSEARGVRRVAEMMVRAALREQRR